ncbi:MAG: hypothetical protein WCI73_00555 [Phycisphaerae bacterium]
MEQFTKDRSGKSPVTFTGKLLAASYGRYAHSRDNNRWHDIEVFRTAAGSYVTVILFQTHWQGEQNRSEVEVSNTAEEAARILETYDPTDGYCRGPEYPGMAGKTFADRDTRTMKDLRDRYQAQVSEVLSTSAEFQERID